MFVIILDVIISLEKGIIDILVWIISVLVINSDNNNIGLSGNALPSLRASSAVSVDSSPHPH